MAKQDFLISYHGSDEAWACWIAAVLEQAGYTTALQAADLRPEGTFVPDLDQAGAEAERTLAVLSPDYCAPLANRPEWTAALVQRPTGTSRKLVSVRVGECEPQGLLRAISCIDLVGVTEEAAAAGRLREVLDGRPPSSTSPARVAAAPPFPAARPPDPAEGVRTLAEALGDLPLAARLASGYLGATGASEGDLLTLLRSRGHARWPEERAPLSPQEAVAALWSLDAVELPRACPGAVDLLRLCAHLAPEGLAVAMLREQAKALPASVASVLQDEAALDGVLTAFRRYALLDGSDPLSLDPLLQTVVREELSQDERRAWAETAVKFVGACFSFEPGDRRRWPEADRLLPHARAAAGHAEELGAAPDVTGRLLNRAAAYLRARGEFAAAKSLLERALVITERTYGREHPAVAVRLNNLGNVLQDLGDLASARARYARALAIDEKAKGPDDPAVAIHLNNLGCVLEAMGDLAGARGHYERALTITEQALGPDHPQLATRLGNLGNVLRALGDVAGGRPYLERALLIEQAARGPSHPLVAMRASNLGSLLHELGDLGGARAQHEAALAIAEGAYGPEHPTVARYATQLGSVLEELGNLGLARQSYDRALAIDEKAYGTNHAAVAADLSNLGSVLNALGDLTGALVHTERALTIHENLYGEGDLRVGTGLYNLACVYANLDDTIRARDLLSRALHIFEESLGPDHPSTVAARDTLAALADQPDEPDR